MEKGKTGVGRGSKSKTPQYPSDLIALGKSSRSGASEPEAKRSGSSKSGSSHSHASGSSSDRKREGPTLPSIVPTKKAKVTSTSAGSSPRAGITGGPESWEIVAVDCDPADLVPSVLEAVDSDQADKYVGLLCGAIRTLKSQRWKPDAVLYLGLEYLCKVRTSLFSDNCVTLALCSALRRDAHHNFKSKGNPAVLVLASALLMEGYVNKKHWPDEFVKLYVEDALNERVWVDHELCAGFVNNILTCVNTRAPPKSLLEPLAGGVLGRASPSVDEAADRPAAQAMEVDDLEPTDIAVRPRYANQQESVEQIILGAVKEQLNRRQPPENITRNFLRLLSSTCGLAEVRLLTASRLELWLQNPKLNRPAQDLLMSVCVNCTTHGVRDIEVIVQLIKIRLKTKALVQLYLAGIRELIAANRSNLETVMKHFVYNELSSTARNPNNMAMLAAMFQSAPEASATLLAEIFLDLLMNREDYLRPLRALLREIARVVRHDMNVPALCRGLMTNRTDLPAFRDFEFKERMFTSVVDLITLCVFLSISPAVREAAGQVARGDKRDVQVLHTYQMQVATIQRDAVCWLSDVAPTQYAPSNSEYLRSLYKLLFLDAPDQYCKVDNWPTESDRALLMRLASDVPVLQHTLMRIFIVSLSKSEERRVTASEALELADQLVKRAALSPNTGLPMLAADKVEIIDLLFNLSTYHHPDTITLPDDFCPPQMAVVPLYWKSWVILLVLAAHNPNTFGVIGWTKYPTLRAFMEMFIMSTFTFPTPSLDDDEYRAREAQLVAREKSQILEYESLLAAASNKTITEQSSLLLSTLITMDPKGICRRPPQSVLDQLDSLNNTHSLDELLTNSRNPDFLRDIIERPGPPSNKQWMAELVNRCELSRLPLASLCECLFTYTDMVVPEKQSKFDQLLAYLQQMLTDASLEPQASCELLDYILRRLGTTLTSSRQQGIKALKLILATVPYQADLTEPMAHQPPLTEDNKWLLRQLPELPHFQAVRSQVVSALRLACQVENDVTLVASYLCFLATHTARDGIADLTDLVQDMAQLIVERSSICAALLPSTERENPGALGTQHALMLMFYAYLQKARSPQRESYPWSESMDQILITWPNREETTMHILVVHALVILLNYGPGLDKTLFDRLLEIWFPAPGQGDAPKAYLVDTTEEALLLPDWLKLRMIRSNVDRLVDAALLDLEPSSLVLFIQSFGIPVKSMNKLLAKLDEAVTVSPGAVGEAVLDKTYMAQLVQVQHHRGAVGGQVLTQVLQLEQPRLPDSVSQSGMHAGRPRLPVAVDPEEEEELTPLRCTDMLETLFGAHHHTLAHHTKQAALRALQKGLTLEIQKVANLEPCLAPEAAQVQPVVLEYFQLMLSYPGTHFVRTLLETPQYSCPLVRLLTYVDRDYQEKILELFRDMVDQIPAGSSSPLVGVLRQYLGKHDVAATGSLVRRHRRLNVRGAFESLQQSALVRLERTGKQLIRSESGTGDLAAAMARLLVQDISGAESRPERTGLLIDWLVELEPELIGASPQLQMTLLFSKPTNQLAASGQSAGVIVGPGQARMSVIASQQVATSSVTAASTNDGPASAVVANETCRPYLLTLLTHRASWLTLHSVVQKLLEDVQPQYDPSAVLDFLWALTCNPRLWQGREKKTPKHHVTEDILCLTPTQLANMVRYAVREAEVTHDSQGRAQVTEKIKSRLALLCQCGETKQQMAVITKLLAGLAAERGTQGTVSQQLLLQLYLRYPGIVFSLPNFPQDDALIEASMAADSTSALDHISHTLFTGLTATPNTKDWSRRGQEYDLALRKLASVHPILTLRQLPMLAASLRGRIHLDWTVLRSRHHLQLLHQVLGILQLLQPHVFRKEYSTAFYELLNTYFGLCSAHMVADKGLQQLKKHSGQKESYALLNQLVDLVQDFISFDAHTALKYLQGCSQLLHDLQRLHPSVVSIRSLLAGIALPTTDDEGEVCVAMPAPQSEASHHQYTGMLAALNTLQGDGKRVQHAARAGTAERAQGVHPRHVCRTPVRAAPVARQGAAVAGAHAAGAPLAPQSRQQRRRSVRVLPLPRVRAARHHHLSARPSARDGPSGSRARLAAASEGIRAGHVLQHQHCPVHQQDQRTAQHTEGLLSFRLVSSQQNDVNIQ